MVLTVKNTEIRYTKSDLKIREFIENSTEEFLFMSIGQLAQRLQVSEATISRFARHIGYRDFKDMKNAVIRKKADQGAARKLAGTLMKNQGFDLAGWFAFQQECMEKTLENLDAEEFDRAVGEYLHRQTYLYPRQECFRGHRPAAVFSGFAVWALMSL